MKLVVDTNIVFSALLNSTGNIAKILLSTNESIEFYSCAFLKDELNLHHKKIQKYTKLSSEQLYNGLVKKNYKKVISTTSLLKKIYR